MKARSSKSRTQRLDCGSTTRSGRTDRRSACRVATPAVLPRRSATIAEPPLGLAIGCSANRSLNKCTASTIAPNAIRAGLHARTPRRSRRSAQGISDGPGRRQRVEGARPSPRPGDRPAASRFRERLPTSFTYDHTGTEGLVVEPATPLGQLIACVSGVAAIRTDGQRAPVMTDVRLQGSRREFRRNSPMIRSRRGLRAW